MKKFFAATIFALMIAVTSSASASDVFAFSQDGIDFYVTQNSGGSRLSYTNAVVGVVVGYKNNEPVGTTIWVFAYQPRPPHKVEVEVRDTNKKVLWTGFLEDDPVAEKVLTAVLAKGKQG